MSIPSDMVQGTIHITRNSGEIKIVNYERDSSVIVEFVETKTRIKTCAGNIRKGTIKDRMKPSVLGVGFLGYGKYKTANKRIHTNEYVAWRNMIARCYDESLRNKYPTYHDCTVCDDWLNFQNFARWYQDNVPNNYECWEVDKDILNDGNRVYSPETCKFALKLENIRKAKCVEVSAVSPCGKLHIEPSLADLCRKNNLSAGCMSQVLRGIKQSHKGWTKPK